MLSAQWACTLLEVRYYWQCGLPGWQIDNT